MELLRSLGFIGNNQGEDAKQGFFDALETLIENLRKECYAKFVFRDDFASFRKRVENLEKEMEDTQKVLVNHSTSIN